MPDHPWFGPKRIGWGWTPITWQGWLLTAVFIAAVMAVPMLPGIRYRFALVSGLTVITLPIVTGTRPGGNS